MKIWSIPRRRILRFEQFFEVKKGQRFAWACHDCHQGAVVPAEYINSFGEIVTLDPENLPEDIILIEF
jgi:hypothetical protein